MNRSLIGALWLGVAALHGCAPELDQAEPAEEQVEESSQALLSSPGFGVVAWEELVPGGTIAELRANLGLLEGRGIVLQLHWKGENLDDAARWSLVQEARSRGIEVWPWLTLPDGTTADNVPGAANYASTGYYPNATNHVAWINKAKSLMALWRARGLPPTTLVVDLEMRKQRLLEFDRLSRSGDLAALVQHTRAGINRAQYSAARSAFKSFVEYAHGQGFKVNATTLLPMIDDYVDGDDSLRQGFNVPLDDAPLAAGAIPWDLVSFQAQRSLYQQSFLGLSPYFVYDYGNLARRYFGAKAGLDIGLTEAGIATNANIAYANGDQLRQDVEAARKAGFATEQIGVYSMLGIYTRPPASQWLQPPRAQPWYWPLPELATAACHASVVALDQLF
jgi:hypothetical protein